MVRKKFAFLALLLTSSAAVAEDWWWLGTFGEGQERFNGYVEVSSAQSDGSRIVSGWVYTHRVAPFSNGEQSSRGWNTVDCQTRQYATGTRTGYDAANREIATIDMSKSVFTANPGTFGAALVDIACGASQPFAKGIANPLAHSTAFIRGASSVGGSTPISTGISTGTGFFVGAAGHVLTSYHVVDGADRIACRTVSGQVHEARLVRSSAANDVALLQVNARPMHYLGFAPAGSTREGQRVFTMGFPAIGILGIDPRFTDGTISALSAAGEDNFLQTSIPIQPGNSGGPVVNEQGQVVGIVAATAAIEPFYRATGSLPQNINWAVKAEYASPLLSPARPAPVLSRDAAISLVRNSICLIVAEGAAE